MKNIQRGWACLAFTALWFCPAKAAVTANCNLIPDSITVDGVLNEPQWKELDTLSMVANNNPTGGTPSQRTRFFVAWSQTRLYVAFMVDSRNVVGTITQHDGDLYDQDVVEMFIDPDGDSKNYLELEWNCLNTTLDYEYAAPLTGLNAGWTATGMLSAVKVHGTANNSKDVDTGLTVEISLPWSTVKPWSIAPLPPRIGDSLSINFYRIDYSTNSAGDLSAWSPTGVADFHRPDKFGRLIFAGPAEVGVLGGKQPRNIFSNSGKGIGIFGIDGKLLQSSHLIPSQPGLRILNAYNKEGIESDMR